MCARSQGVRAEMCWQGRQEMRADILELSDGGEGGGVGSAAVEIVFILVDLVGWFDGVSVKLTSSHQSSSVQEWIPLLANHCLLPSGTKKWHFGCSLWISWTVGRERWS